MTSRGFTSADRPGGSAHRLRVAALVVAAWSAADGLACRRSSGTRAPDRAAEGRTTPPPAATGPGASAAATQGGVAGASRRRLPRIDVHMHIDRACLDTPGCPRPDAIERGLALMNRWGIDGAVNLSGMSPGPPLHSLETQLASARQAKGRIAVFANADFELVLTRGDYGRAMAAGLEDSKKLGAIGLKIPKGLGLGYPAPGGRSLLAVDDPGLDPLFEKAGALGMPIAVHVGDPKAFWRRADPANERWDELQSHPAWSFHGKRTRDGKPVPTWEQLYDAFERRVARHPRTTFIGVHFGNAPEEPDRVARMLDRYPNFFIDTGARVPEIGRHPVEKMRRFYEKYQDRVLFGTDTGVGQTQDEMMYGSTGLEPATEADEMRFFNATWRYFETIDRQFDHPTPIQGRWKIDGVGLSEAILRKVYFENAARILRWKPPVAPEAAAAP